MNLHFDRYLAGAAFFVGVVYRKGGQRPRVFPPGCGQGFRFRVAVLTQLE